MRNSFAFALAILLEIVLHAPASAMPIFAQRYHLQCTACHTVLPELNAFGNYFRDHGYRLQGLPKHGTTGIAIRYQMEYEKDPVAGTRRFTPGGVLLAAPEIGAINAFLHYNLGAGGGPGGAFLAYLATYNHHTQSLYRAGLFELPLRQSPGQRLDDLSEYGYYGAHVGLNDLSLASPRWGIQLHRNIGQLTFDAVADQGEFKGAAYGGKPIATGETTSAGSPELGLFFSAPLGVNLQAGGAVLAGNRHISVVGKAAFADAYRRENLFAHASFSKVDLQAEQWWGNDANADGFSTAVFSSGGYARVKYYLSPHAYAAVRYDAAETPLVSRTAVFYGGTQVTPHARLILERRQPLGGGGPGSLGAAVTVGFPWPSNL